MKRRDYVNCYFDSAIESGKENIMTSGRISSVNSNRPSRSHLSPDELTELKRNTRSARTAIGAEVRAIRRRLNLTQAEFAKKVGLSTGMISKIEHGSVAASVEVLVMVAQCAGTSFSKFFSGLQEAKSCLHIPAGNGVLVTREGSDHNFAHYLMGHWFTEQGLSELYLVAAQRDATPFYFRKSGLIFLHMLTGKLHYRHGSGVFRLEPGDTLSFDATSLNGPDVIDEYPVSYLLWRQTPGSPKSATRNRGKAG